MTEESDWITRATTPLSTPDEFEQLRQSLDDARIETALEEHLVRQCENDPDFMPRVHARDLPLAWDFKFSITTAKD